MRDGSTETAALSHYRTLREGILSGAIDAEQRLYESALTTELGTSRTPIREALTMLEKDGLLRRERRGYRVRERTLQEILDYFDVRRALEAAAAEGAAERATELERTQMSRLLESAAAQTDHARKAEIHLDWHRALHRASHNDAIIGFIERAETLIRLHSRPWDVTIAGDDDSQAEHESILQAVLERDPVLARERMMTHMARARDFQLEVMTRQPESV
ncbi:GntR family transcriptional regulator [Leucobacter weissii]|uniref:GntR family transcriptional regulator n=1 Tax=Leucobacter weissii TaxID=1983706 RepID=A0A939SAW8_9MICO|nr:GntR family transcriptional regulator [Leucobacter weissii]MBO1902382.1 GntR family transcriptional regulator [Leucobacter weissii]